MTGQGGSPSVPVDALESRLVWIADHGLDPLRFITSALVDGQISGSVANELRRRFS